MLTTTHQAGVYLACGSTDMRKSINALSVMVATVFELDLFSESLFVFCNRGRDKIKILRWDCNGFWLYYRRLERGHFDWPNAKSGQTLSLDRRQLQWLLDGLSVEQIQAHKPVLARQLL